MRDPAWQAVVRVYNEKAVSPLCDWPSGWVQWVSSGLIELEHARNERAREDMEAARRGR